MDNKAYLILENGDVFEGRRFGAAGDIIGELVFATGMVGYLETLTDCSYHGQIVVQTFPLIGNYGVIPEDFESDRVAVRAYIVKSWCESPSNFRSQGDLDTFLKEQNVIGLYDVDTRALTRIIREKGVMNGVIVGSLENVDMEAVRNYRIVNAVDAVSSKDVHVLQPEGEARYRVALLDYGYKRNIVNELLKRGCELTVYPHDTHADTILATKPDGIMLSNGPGDPAENVFAIEQLRRLMEAGVPIFGICLGHQLLARANGFRTDKLKYGHRGGNQPVRDEVDGRIYITSQNHGYAVVAESLDERIAKPRFTNVNDGTNEGVDYLAYPAFSVQFHPEACCGPQDTMFLFERFLDMMKEGAHAAR